IAPRSAPPPPGRPNDRATAESCVAHRRASYTRPDRPGKGQGQSTNRRQGQNPSAKQAGGTRRARNRLKKHPTHMTFPCACASAIAAARASSELAIRACARRERARVRGDERLLLFDIVNVQKNWTALSCNRPPLFGMRSGSAVHLSICHCVVNAL